MGEACRRGCDGFPGALPFMVSFSSLLSMGTVLALEHAVDCDAKSTLLTPSFAATTSLTLRPSPKLTLPLSFSFSRSLASFSLFAAIWNLATKAETYVEKSHQSMVFDSDGEWETYAALRTFNGKWPMLSRFISLLN